MMKVAWSCNQSRTVMLHYVTWTSSWAENTGYEMNIEPISYDYECGLNCKYKNGFNVCEKTLN